MLEMEHSVGLQCLSPTERDIYYAASEISKIHSDVETAYLLSHVLVANISRPTFFRALKSLIKKGYLAPCVNSGRGQYTVHEP